MNTNDHIRAVVFDLDGTLFDTLPSLTAATNEVLRSAGLRAVPPQLLRAALSEGLHPMFRQALALQSSETGAIEAQVLERELQSVYASRWLREASLFEGASALVSALHERGVSLAVCTNRDRSSAQTILDGAGLRLRFDVIVGVDDTPRPKPAADPLLRVLDLLSLSAPDVLFVGDSGLDARCAASAQVRFAAYLGGYAASREDLRPQALHFDHHDQLTEWVLARVPQKKEGCRA